MPISESLLRARYCNQDFPGCRTTDKLVKANRKGFLVEGVCKACGKTHMFRTENIRTVKSCGCLNHRDQRTQEGSMLDLFEKLKGETHGNLTFLGESARSDGYWHIRCQCTVCGAIVWRRYDFWSKRTATRCTCDINKGLNPVDRRFSAARWDIEHIWPNVVRAGRQALEAHRG